MLVVEEAGVQFRCMRISIYEYVGRSAGKEDGWSFQRLAAALAGMWAIVQPVSHMRLICTRGGGEIHKVGDVLTMMGFDMVYC